MLVLRALFDYSVFLLRLVLAQLVQFFCDERVEREDPNNRRADHISHGHIYGHRYTVGSYISDKARKLARLLRETFHNDRYRGAEFPGGDLTHSLSYRRLRLDAAFGV
mgnify:CR=1 FL=1